MYFRCPDCLSSTWIDDLEPPRESDTVACQNCEGSFSAAPVPGLSPSIGNYYRRSLELSNEKQIDMPTAYSVVLGLLTLDDVRRLQGLAPSEQSPPEPRADPAETLLVDLDPGFQKAIADGCLTIQEAIRRGNREAHAAGLAKRHGLATEVAYRVTDNRLSLHKAIKLRPVPPSPEPPKRSATRMQRRIVLGIAMLGLAGFTWAKWTTIFNPVRRSAQAVTSRAPAAPAVAREEPVVPTRARPSDAPATTQVVEDSMGRITRVEGPDPTAVLAAFCSHGGPVVSKQPIEITETVSQSQYARLGVFRDLDSLATDQAIRIRRDSRTRRWVAGDGVRPVPVRAAPTPSTAVLQASVNFPAIP